MSRLGRFAKRYEQVQRGLQDMAQRQLAEHRRTEQGVLESLHRIRTQKRETQASMTRLCTGHEWQSAWARLQVFEVQEAELAAALTGCREQINEATAEVLRTYQEAKRWDTLATRESTRELAETERKSIQAGDDLAVQSHGRFSP